MNGTDDEGNKLKGILDGRYPSGELALTESDESDPAMQLSSCGQRQLQQDPTDTKKTPRRPDAYPQDGEGDREINKDIGDNVGPGWTPIGRWESVE